MRDGTVLRATVYRPAAVGPWPTLVTRTPYGKDLPGVAAWLDPVRAAAAGFLVVVQDVRGRFASGGEWEPFAHESADGFDTVEWAARLPGSNGRVGMFGVSYWGNTQWLAAIAQPPSLCAIAPGLTWSDPGDGLVGRGGALQLATGMVWGLEQGLDTLRRRGESSTRIERLLDEIDRLGEKGVWRLPASVAALLDLYGVPGLAAGADACRVTGAHARVRVPVLGIGGWYDAFTQGVLDNHTAITELGGDSRVVIGPWSHGNFSDEIGDLRFGIRARRDGGPLGDSGDLTAMQLAWFAQHLSLDGGRSPDLSSVRIFVMGANRWRDEPTWPPPGAAEQRWYLRAAGGLTIAAPRVGEGVSEFVYDPADPAPSSAPTSSPEPVGPTDQATVEARPDVLVFTSEPLRDDLEVAGPVRVTLNAQSSAPSTDWVARLCDVHPDGTSYNLCDGIVRVADGADQSRHHEVDLWSTCHRFRAGHRLRLQVTSSSFPRWDRNLNTGRQDEARSVAARQRIAHDRERLSWLALTVV
jgi:uncharacterized protein